MEMFAKGFRLLAKDGRDRGKKESEMPNSIESRLRYGEARSFGHADLSGMEADGLID